MRNPIEPSWFSLASPGSVQEGQTIRTDGKSQALLTLLDHSTVIVGSGTELKLSRMGVSRFTGQRAALQLELLQGRIHVGVAPAAGVEREIVVHLAGGRALLEEGNYTFTAGDGRGQVRVGELGGASAWVGRNGPLPVTPGHRVQWGADGVTDGPEIAADELIYNGDFAWGLQGWRVGNSLGFPEGTDVEGQATLETGSNGRPVVNFFRRYSHSTHCETYLYQDIDRDVSDYTRLALTITFQLKYQNLSGGGYMGSEYPMSVRVVYKAPNGDDQVAFTGFYYHNQTGNRLDFGQKVPQDQWQTVTIPLKSSAVQPQRIMSVQVSASGWDYESQVQSISLSGQ